MEFREAAVAGLLREAAELVRRELPGVPVGFFGLEQPSACDGAAFDLLGRAVDWRGGSFRPGARRLALEFAPPGRALARRVDDAAGRDAVRSALSGALLQVFGPEQRDAALACQPLACGLGRFIETSTPPRPSAETAGFPGAQVALVYSKASVRASFLMDVLAGARPTRPDAGPARSGEVPFGSSSAASWDRVWEGWCALLSDLGVPFVPVREEDVRQGALRPGRFRVAILPRMMSVSDGAARELRRFAASGGVLIADAGTGMFDGALARVRGSEAQKLFGIEHADAARFSEVGDRRRMIAGGQLRLVKPVGTASWFAPRGPLGVGPAESGLVLAGARAEGVCRAVDRGDVPCLTVNPVGGGWAVTLNLAISAHLELRALPRGGKAMRELVAEALKRARVRPAVELTYDEGTYPPPSVDVRDAGGVRLVVLARDEHRGPAGRVHSRSGRRGAEAARVHVRFASSSPPAVYEALEGVFMGWTSIVETDLAPGDVRLFALFPYRLRSIVAEPLGPPPGCARPGPEAFEVTLRKQGEAPFELHVLKLTVEGPEGRARPELAALLEVAGGRAAFVVPFAADDPPGLWTLRLRDAATGTRTVRRFARPQQRGPPRSSSTSSSSGIAEGAEGAETTTCGL
jgi:hypothetical protein